MKKTEITPQEYYYKRRDFLKKMSLAGLLLGFSPRQLVATQNKFILNSSQAITPKTHAQNYNNYYEFSTNKEAVKMLSKDFTISPWSIRIEGEVENPLTISMNDINQLTQVKRIYPLRCVEGWSMVIPWSGIELNSLLALAKLKSTANYVKFVGTQRPSEMFSQRQNVLPWPYTEGLRIDEAMHPLTLLATGMYEETITNQNGAPVRLLVPWKYGFKSIKAIQTIVVLRDKPVTSWNQQIPSEYGFYANVNPKVSHPRWSQSREVRIGELRKRATLPFNGYENEVKHLYKGMDLAVNF